MIAVLSPTPIVTVTIEPGRLEGDQVHLHAGGQGLWVARQAARLEHETVLCAPVGGEAGRLLPVLVEAEGVRLRAVESTQPNGVVVDDRRAGEREHLARAPAHPLDRHTEDELFGEALAAGLEAHVMVVTGDDPPGVVSHDFYRRLLADLAANGCATLADLSGDALREALAGGAGLIAVSHEELVACGLAAGGSREELLAGMRAARRAGAHDVIVSRAEEPALALVEDGVFELEAPRFEAVEHRGGGDSMTAAAAVALAEGRSRLDACRMAMAAGALNVARRGLGTGRRAQVDEVTRHVEVRELEPAALQE